MWLVCANSQFATVFSYFFLSFFVFFGNATGNTVRQIWTTEGSKCVVPCKEVPFGGLNNVPLNFGSKIPPKLKFLGRE